jgi:hypothetical protein
MISGTIAGEETWGSNRSNEGPMHTAFIKFLSREDRIRGFYQLATRASVSSLPDDIFQVPAEALKLLDAERVAYRRASDAEVKAAHDQVRNPPAAVL